jgi:leucyl-tRNA synthetase
LRDAVFSSPNIGENRFLCIINGLPQMIDATHLPIVLPEVEKYLPRRWIATFRNAEVWHGDTLKMKWSILDLVDHKTIFPLELNTIRLGRKPTFMDALYGSKRMKTLKKLLAYWESVDLYIGGNEHDRSLVVLSFLE